MVTRKIRIEFPHHRPSSISGLVMETPHMGPAYKVPSNDCLAEKQQLFSFRMAGGPEPGRFLPLPFRTGWNQLQCWHLSG
jgi:hypothetical protein